METILQKPNYGDYRLCRPNTETPYISIKYIYIDRYIDLSEILYGDPILWGLYYGDLISIIETTMVFNF